MFLNVAQLDAKQHCGTQRRGIAKRGYADAIRTRRWNA
jgi:hypothetical protein